MSHRTTLSHPKVESQTTRVTGTLKDEKKNPIPAGSINTLTLTLYDRRTGNIINSRDGMDILNVNGGTVVGQGDFALELSPGDMVIVDSGLSREVHIALIKFTYGTGKSGAHEVEIAVVNLVKVP